MMLVKLFLIQLLTSRILPIADFHIGGSACINGKTITLAQGLANIAPEHKRIWMN